MAVVPVKVSGRVLRPHKAVVAPDFRSRTVLTDDPWTFVALSLKRRKKDEALFYWEQGYQFHRAAEGLPLQSVPLVLYYSFMNAAKALLAAKGIPFVAHHGVKEWNTSTGTRLSLRSVGVQIKNTGVLPSLSSYYGETEPRKRHTLQELFFNLPFVHRTYCLTYKSQRDMFIPLRECRYVTDVGAKKAYLAAELSGDHVSKHTMNRLPAALQADPGSGPSAIRSKASVPFGRPNTPTDADLQSLGGLHRQLRSDLVYINGAETLWYAKAVTSGPRQIQRQAATITLAAMHRLSEICRYNPIELASHLSGQKNWLLSEFIRSSPRQFCDEIAAELTGHQVMLPNVRSAT